MGVLREEDALGHVKKSTKRKKTESSAVTGENGCNQVGDEVHKMKTKKEVSHDTDACKKIAQVDCDSDVGISSTKKEKNEKSKTDKKCEDDDGKTARKKKKSRLGEEGGASIVSEAAEKTTHKEAKDRGFSELKTRKKEKIKEIERIDVNTMKDKEKNSFEKPNQRVASDLELVTGGEEQATEEGRVKKKKKKKKTVYAGEDDSVDDAGSLQNKTVYAGEDDRIDDAGSLQNQIDREVIGKAHPEQIKERKKQKLKEGDLAARDKDLDGSHVKQSVGKSSKSKVEKSIRSNNKGDVTARASNINDNEVDKVQSSGKKKKKKKMKGEDYLRAASSDKELLNDRLKHPTEGDASASVSGTINTTELSEKSTSGKKAKKVRFSGDVEVFPLPDNSIKWKKKLEDGSKGRETLGDGLVRGKRFSLEEDEIIKKAVNEYVEAHRLGEKGIEMIMECQSHPEVKGCWTEIAEALPWRPRDAIYYRAHILFQRSESRSWTPEELELVKEFHERHGPDWKTLAVELGKHRFHVKDTWRRLRLPNKKKGHWSQDEYQNLFNLVNKDLCMKALDEKKTKHGMLRDNISWEAISDELSTRSNVFCCIKWYQQLTSPMVAEGKWADTDDYRMLMSLVEVDPSCEEDVDWDNLLEHRTGDVCRKRWHQMLRHIGEHRTSSFSEQVDVLSQRYCPELLEAREAYDSKTPVD